MSDDEILYDSSSDVSDFEDDEEMAENQDNDSDSSPAEDEDNMSEDGFVFDDIVPARGKGKQKTHEIEADSLSVTSLEAKMRKQAEHIASLFGGEISTAYILLRHHRWNKDKLIERYMEDPDMELLEAGLPPASLPAATPAAPATPKAARPAGPSRRSTRQNVRADSVPPSSSKTPGSFMCPICCDDEASGARSLGCGHTYCSNCWETYLHSKIREEGEVAIKCMHEDCRVQADDVFIRANTKAEDADRYLELLVRDYVSNTSQIKFCPHPGCSNAISCPAASSKNALRTLVPTVRCSENHPFCFGCSLEGGHAPVICYVSKMWLKKCADDSETANWIKSNTKECTKCQSTIEKNGGCNHMTCKKCKHEFCWVCMGDWQQHGNSWYSCNRYDEKDGVEARDQQSKSRASLERYLHYYNRWANHEQSAKLSLELYEKTEKKMEEMQNTSSLTWIEVQFAKKAVDEIIKCRMTLKWTYSMAYYLEKGNSKDLFEDNQADLEKAVEDLSELLETPIEPENITSLRQKITDKTVYVFKRNEVVLEDTARGFTEERWSWNIPMP